MTCKVTKTVVEKSGVVVCKVDEAFRREELSGARPEFVFRFSRRERELVSTLDRRQNLMGDKTGVSKGKQLRNPSET